MTSARPFGSAPKDRFSRRTALAALVAASVGLAGCVNVPTTSEVTRVEASGRAREPQIAVQVKPPINGASPRLIVSGFMEAMKDYQANYEIARMYLSVEARDSWRPESGVQIVSNNAAPIATEDSAKLQAQLVGELGPDNSYRWASGKVDHDFKLVKDTQGQWRISGPPSGLLITQFDFEQFYRPINLYFFEPGMGSLVPDPIYLPRANLSAAVVARRLLAGPSEWLRPAVVTAFPEGTPGLTVPVDMSGVADVPLNEAANTLDGQQRTLLMAQTVWTLRQIVGVTGVRFRVNGAPYVVPGSVDGVVSVDALGSFGPTNPQTSIRLFAATGSGLVRLDDTVDGGNPESINGPLGQRQGIDEFAISQMADQAAVVAGGRSELWVGQLGDGLAARMTIDATDLRRPQYTRFDELLLLGNRGGATVLWHIRDRTVQRVEVSTPKGMTLAAFRVASDGVRVVVVLTDAKGVSHLGLMSLIRTGIPTLRGYREVRLTLPQGTSLASLRDVVWSSPTSLIVLGSEAPDDQARPYELNQDGTELVALGRPEQWNAVRVTAAPVRDAGGVSAIGARVAMLGNAGTSWRYANGATWVVLAQGITAIAYPL